MWCAFLASKSWFIEMPRNRDFSGFLILENIVQNYDFSVFKAYLNLLSFTFKRNSIRLKVVLAPCAVLMINLKNATGVVGIEQNTLLLADLMVSICQEVFRRSFCWKNFLQKLLLLGVRIFEFMVGKNDRTYKNMHFTVICFEFPTLIPRKNNCVVFHFFKVQRSYS